MARPRASVCFGAGAGGPGGFSLLDSPALDGFKRVALTGGGDVNGDGYDEVAFSVRSDDGSSPELYLVGGGPSRASLVSSRVRCVRATGFAEPNGYAVATSIIGDFNGDAFDDLAVGANDLSTPPALDRVEIFFGGAGSNLSARCASPTAVPLPAGVEPRARFGYALR